VRLEGRQYAEVVAEEFAEGCATLREAWDACSSARRLLLALEHLRSVDWDAERPQYAEFATRCAESVLSIYEARHPGDTRPRDAIAAARRANNAEAAARGEEAGAGALETEGAATWAAAAAFWAARAAGQAANRAASAARAAGQAAGWAAWLVAEAEAEAAEVAAWPAREAALIALEEEQKKQAAWIKELWSNPFGTS